MRLIPALLAIVSIMAPTGGNAQDKPSDLIILAEEPTPDGAACGIKKGLIEAVAKLNLMGRGFDIGSMDDPGPRYYLHIATTTQRSAGQCTTYTSVRILTNRDLEIAPGITAYGHYILGETGYLFSTRDSSDAHSRRLAWDLDENINKAFESYAANVTVSDELRSAD